MGTFAVGFHWVHPYPFTPFYNSSYGTMPESRRWQSAPEYYTFIKPVFTIESITLEWAEQYVNEKAREINKTSLLNNSYRYGESDWHSIG